MCVPLMNRRCHLSILNPCLLRMLILFVLILRCLVVRTGFDVMNSCGVMHDARVNSSGLHSARGNSGRHIIRTGVLVIHAVEFGEEQSQGV